MDAIIEELARAEEFPEQTVRYCLDHPDQVVPGFLDLLRYYAGNPSLTDDRDGALFFIIHILGELGDTRAFGPLMDFLSGDQQQVKEILGEAITETLPRVLIGVFDGQTDRLYGVMNDPSVDEYVRHAAFMTWVHEVASGRIDMEEAECYLLACFDELRPRGESENYVWVAWVESIAWLGLDSLKPLVRQAFEKNLVPYFSLVWEDFEEILGGRLAASDPMAFLAGEKIAPFRDTIGTLSKWHAFSPEYIEAKQRPPPPKPRDMPALSRETVANPYRHVGRNDPCPCGSGKKFKQCCLS
ncbi:MAG: DUF1186 domain-containing protein [Proteobacteria bacterium]|nr:DUF1186 domain-containing protein [Pseudomonadota bacterium]